MNQTTDASQQYLRNAVMTATPEQLHLMLYDGAIRFALRGREAIEKSDREQAFLALERAQRIVLELTAGLNRDANPRLANQMVGLYDFIYRRLIDANVDQDLRALDEAVLILRHQRETWLMLIEKLQREGRAGVSAPRTMPESGSDPVSEPSGEEDAGFSVQG